MELRRLFLVAITPLSKLLGKLHLSPSKRRCKATHARSIAARAQAGDILLSRMAGELSNIAIEGYWSHSAIFIGGEIPTIVDATGDGVREVDLFDFVLSKDNVVLLRPNLPENTRQAAAQGALQFVGRPYDYLFESSDEAFYCSELAWTALNNASIATEGKPFSFTKRQVWGEYTVLPQDFINATKHFQSLYKCFSERRG